jgi:hypothetical protein
LDDETAYRRQNEARGIIRDDENLKPCEPQHDISITGAAWLLVSQSLIQDKSRAEIPRKGCERVNEVKMRGLRPENSKSPPWDAVIMVS